MKTIGLWCGIVFLGVSTCAADAPTARELLASYQRTVARLARFGASGVRTTEAPAVPGRDERQREEAHFEVYRDGTRWRLTQTVTVSRAIGTAKAQIGSMSELIVGETVVAAQSHDRHPAIHDARLVVVAWNDKQAAEQKVLERLGSIGIILGVAPGDERPVWQVLAEGATLELRPDREVVSGRRTYVVSGTGRTGRRTLWLDPDRGCLPLRFESHQNAAELPLSDRGDVSRAARNGRRANLARRSPTEYLQRFEEMEISDVEGVPVVTAFKCTRISKFAEGAESEWREECHVTGIDLAGRDWTAATFGPTIEIPSGTPVSVLDAPGIRYAWADGKLQKVVDPAVVANAAGLEFSAPKATGRFWWLVVINGGAAGAAAVWLAIWALRHKRTRSDGRDL